MDLIKYTTERYNYYMREKSDPRVENFPLMDSPMPTVYITILYVAAVYFGPKMMKDKEAYKLTNILIVYNFVLCLVSGYGAWELLMSGWWNDYSLRCQPVDYSNNPKAIRMINTLWYGFIVKIIELLDTIFFILRKKNNQLSYLHVFHHGCLPLNCWFALKFVGGGFGTFGCLLNATVHFVMYFYYFLSAFGDRFRKYLFWKRYLTTMQMVQFVIMLVHGSQLFYIECDYPIEWAYWASCYVVLFLFCFANFYIQEYHVRQKRNMEKIKKSS